MSSFQWGQFLNVSRLIPTGTNSFFPCCFWFITCLLNHLQILLCGFLDTGTSFVEMWVTHLLCSIDCRDSGPRIVCDIPNRQTKQSWTLCTIVVKEKSQGEETKCFSTPRTFCRVRSWWHSYLNFYYLYYKNINNNFITKSIFVHFKSQKN